MPQVPKYNQQIQQDTPHVVVPPTIDRSGNLTALNKNFEADQSIAKAGLQIGEVLAKHAQEQQELKNDQLDSQVYTSYARDMQNKLFNDQPETIKVNGQDVTRPSGYLNRELGQAHGSVQELDQYYNGTARNQYLSQITDPRHQAKVAAMMDTHFDTVRGTVIGHEAKQGRADLINTFESGIKQQISDAYGAQTPEALKTAVINSGITQDSLNKTSGLDEASAGVAKQDTYSAIIENSVMGKLKATGDTKQANSLLDSAKESLSPENYEALKEKVAKVGDSLEKQLQENMTKQKVATRFDYIDQIANGKMTWDNSGEAIKSVSQKDQELAEAMQKVVTTPDYSAQEADNDAYQTMVKGIFNSGSQEEVSKFLVDALHAKSNGEISRDRLAILVSAAKQRAQNLPPTTNNIDGTPQNPAQVAIDAGMKAATGYYEKHNNPDILDNYLIGIASNKSPQEALQMAIGSHAVKVNPVLQTINKNGRVMIDGSGNMATVYADGTFEELNSPKKASK